MSTISTTITVGSGPNALSLNGNTSPVKLYVANQTAGTVTVIRLDTNAVVTTTTVGYNPIAVISNTSNNFTFVANSGSGTVSKIDGTSNAVSSTITPSTNTGVITDLAQLTPTSNSRFLIAQYNGVTAVTSNGEVQQALSVVCNGKIAVNTTTNQAYVLDQLLNQVAVLNVSAGGLSLVGYLALRTMPACIGVNTTTNKVYIGNFLDNSITVLNGGTTAADMPTVAQTIKYGNGYTDMIVNPTAIGVNTTTNMIYVAQANTPNVLIIDGSTISSTYMTTRNLNIGVNPQALAVDATANRVYVVSPEGYITTISGATAGAVSTASVATILNNSSATLPSKVIVNTGTSLAYVTNNRSNNVTVVSA